MEDLVAIARVAKPRGLKGEMIADIVTDFPERFDDVETITAVFSDGTTYSFKLEKSWFQSGRVVLKFDGIDRVEDAEKFRNADICVNESEAVELESDEYFDWQLEGCSVETVEGETIGVVTSLMRTGATEILVVKGEKEYLIPFAEAICTRVDIENTQIVIDPPEGLLEF
ncbi:MAG TPA: ribosome maturation factor RimM [Pyrinomonadaceae bacterium]|nr:ribosome maturation factor RimM [Pyrinomonadaceae bacterium]